MIPVHIKITSVNFPLKIRTFWSAIIYFVTTFLLKCWSIIQIECIITALGVDRFSNKFAYCCVLVWRHYRNESGFETHILTNNMTILYQNDLFLFTKFKPLLLPWKRFRHYKFISIIWRDVSPFWKSLFYQNRPI